MGLSDRLDALLGGVFNIDTWSNVLSGLGVKGRDRRRDTTIDVDPVTEEEARAYWRCNFLARSCIEMIPDTAFREGFTFKLPGGEGEDDSAKKLSEAVHTRLEDLEVVPQFIQAAKFERAYGGAGLFPVCVDGTTNFAQPLREHAIQKCTAVHVFEPRELQVRTWYDDIMDKGYRRPRTYMLQPTGSSGFSGSHVEVHESRLVMLRGIRVSNDQTIAERPGYGDNALTVAKQTLADVGIGFGAAFAMLDQFSQGILQLNGLGQMLAEDQGKKVRDRLMIMDQTKSVLRTLVVDKEDTFKREHVSFSGVPDILKIGMYFIAAAFGVPVALLFGMEPAGMNATGAFDIRAFYDQVVNMRKSRYETPVERLVRLTSLLPKDGPTQGKEPEQWSLEWKPLWQMSDKEREETRKMRTDNDVALIDAQIASADEIRSARFGGDTYSYELQLTGPAPVADVPDEHVKELEAAKKRIAEKKPGGLRALAERALAEPDDEDEDAEPDDEDVDEEEGDEDAA